MDLGGWSLLSRPAISLPLDYVGLKSAANDIVDDNVGFGTLVNAVGAALGLGALRGIGSAGHGAGSADELAGAVSQPDEMVGALTHQDELVGAMSKPGGESIALGLERGPEGSHFTFGGAFDSSTLLGRFSRHVNAKHYRKWGGYEDLVRNRASNTELSAWIERHLHDASEIHFNLDMMGRRSFRRYLRGKSSGGDFTNWELKTILDSPALRAKTTFYSPSSSMQKIIDQMVPEAIRTVFP